MTISITVYFGGHEIYRLISSEKLITIGRMKHHDIQLDNIGVSKLHARIFEQDGVYMLEDCTSTNGTYHNDKLIEIAEPLHEGDVIRIVKHILTISFPNKTGDYISGAYPNTISLGVCKK